MIMPPIAGANITSIFLKFFLILCASDLQIKSALSGWLNNFAHWTYLEECSPDDKTKWPSMSALVFLKISKDFLC